MVNKHICSYMHLKGICVNEMPSEDILDLMSPSVVQGIIKHCYPALGSTISGVASAFWGEGNQKRYNRIYDLDAMAEHVPVYCFNQGVFVPTIGGCGHNQTGNVLDRLRKEMLKDTLDRSRLIYFGNDNDPDERIDRYFALTIFDGCCNFGGGKVDIPISDFELLVLGLAGRP